MSEWIPCKERMPILYREVLISCEFGFRLIAMYAGKQEYRNEIVNCFETDAGELIKCDVVKAWMPLPDPYEGD